MLNSPSPPLRLCYEHLFFSSELLRSHKRIMLLAIIKLNHQKWSLPHHHHYIVVLLVLVFTSLHIVLASRWDQTLHVGHGIASRVIWLAHVLGSVRSTVLQLMFHVHHFLHASVLHVVPAHLLVGKWPLARPRRRRPAWGCSSNWGPDRQDRCGSAATTAALASLVCQPDRERRFSDGIHVMWWAFLEWFVLLRALICFMWRFSVKPGLHCATWLCQCHLSFSSHG